MSLYATVRRMTSFKIMMWVVMGAREDSWIHGMANIYSRERADMSLILVWFVVLRPSQQLWSCRVGQFTFLGKLDK